MIKKFKDWLEWRNISLYELAMVVGCILFLLGFSTCAAIGLLSS
jgi:hypothetical protein